MAQISAAFAKLIGVQRSVNAVLTDNQSRGGGNRIPSRPPGEVEHYFTTTATILELLRRALPSLYGDFHAIDITADTQMGANGINPITGQSYPPYYSHRLLQQLARDIAQILEIRANSELEQPKSDPSMRCVFITHGNTDEWRKVQPYVERDLDLKTIELAQEANAGQTIIEKLFANVGRCDSAVIVWTGDDRDEKGSPRARENVMHEIGFFQGKYGRGRVILLHEDGVNIPTNLSGVVYSPFAKGGVEASLHLLGRELKQIYGN